MNSTKHPVKSVDRHNIWSRICHSSWKVCSRTLDILQCSTRSRDDVQTAGLVEKPSAAEWKEESDWKASGPWEWQGWTDDQQEGTTGKVESWEWQGRGPAEWPSSWANEAERDQAKTAWDWQAEAAEEWEDDGWLPTAEPEDGPPPQETDGKPEIQEQDWWKEEPNTAAAEDVGYTQPVQVPKRADLMQEGMPFKATDDLEVRQAANPRSARLQTLRAGHVVYLLGKPLEVACDINGIKQMVLRVPIKPRGWVNADALQPLAERGAPGLVAETGNLPKAAMEAPGFENFEAVFDDPSPSFGQEKGKGSKKGGKTAKKTRNKENDGKGWPSADWKEAKEVTYGGSQQVDPLMVNDPWQACVKEDPLTRSDPWAANSYGKSEAYPYPKPEKKSEKKFENDWSQANKDRDPIFENDPWASTQERKPLQAWQPPKEAPAKQQDFLEAALGPLDSFKAKEEMKEWDQFKVNEERFGVKSTYQEEYYTTPLDQNQVSREVFVKANHIANEIESKANGRLLGNGWSRETRDSLSNGHGRVQDRAGIMAS
eukprot:symbB.v1.2.014508.t1/scaffold1062.1/size140384/7